MSEPLGCTTPVTSGARCGTKSTLADAAHGEAAHRLEAELFEYADVGMPLRTAYGQWTRYQDVSTSAEQGTPPDEPAEEPEEGYAEDEGPYAEEGPEPGEDLEEQESFEEEEQQEEEEQPQDVYEDEDEAEYARGGSRR